MYGELIIVVHAHIERKLASNSAAKLQPEVGSSHRETFEPLVQRTETYYIQFADVRVQLPIQGAFFIVPRFLILLSCSSTIFFFFFLCVFLATVPRKLLKAAAAAVGGQL